MRRRSRRRARRATLLLCGVLLTGCAAGFPAQPTHESFGLTNFAKVSDEVYRSGQPDEKELDYLVKHYGIKSVVKLNGGKNPANIPLVEAPRISGLGVVTGRYCPTSEKIKEILDAIDRAPKPVLIHCLHGEDRTGLIVALWRIRHGATVAEAYTDMMRRGFHSNYAGVWKAWLRETGWDRPDTDAAPSAMLASKASCPSGTLAAEPLVEDTRTAEAVAADATTGATQPAGLAAKSAAAKATPAPMPIPGTASAAQSAAPAGAM